MSTLLFHRTALYRWDIGKYKRIEITHRASAESLCSLCEIGFRHKTTLKMFFSNATSAEALVEILSSSGFGQKPSGSSHTTKYMFSQK